MRNIQGSDDRIIVNEENFEFFDSVIAVDNLDNNGAVESVGSGIIVSPQHVLTAAHVIFSTSSDTSITFYDPFGARVIFADDFDKKDFLLSPTIDGEGGQSGSGILTFLEGNPSLIKPDPIPRMATIFSYVNPNNIGTAAIDKPVYDNIVSEIGRVGGTENGNDLPENAIIGKNVNVSNADDIVGSYRRERILGLGGNDVLEGMGADDRLEGGEGDDRLEGGSGNDKLTGGAGDDELNGGSDGVIGIGIPGLPEELLPGGDIAIYSGNSSEYDIERSGLLGTTLTITHQDGGIDGTDTLTGIEFVQFEDTIRAFPFGEDDGIDKRWEWTGYY